MKSVLLHSYDHVTSRACCRLINPKHVAITAAIYTLNISILVILLYSWRISVNAKKFASLEDVYYGVQIAYLAIIGTHLFMIVLSIVLLLGVYRVQNAEFENPISEEEVDGFATQTDMTAEMLTVKFEQLPLHLRKLPRA